LVRSARIHRLVQDSGTFGTRTGAVALDWDALLRRQHAVVRGLIPDPASFERTGARIVLAEARFVDPHTVEAGGESLRAERIVVAAGSEPVVPALAGRELAITSDRLLFLQRFPERLVMVGAGAIGLEMAAAFADLGAQVTVIGREREILPAFDEDVAAYLRQLLEARGVRFVLGATVERLGGAAGAVTAHYTTGAGPGRVTATQVCLAVGRRYNPARAGTDDLGLERGPLGLRVDPYLRTTRPHIYAAGDAAGLHQLTPTAAYEGRLAADNALRGDTRTVGDPPVPQTIFTTPEIARVGLTHRRALAAGIACAVARHDTRGASNGRATGEDAGYLKLIVDTATDRVVGVQMVSHAAAELIQLATLAIRSGAPAAVLAEQLTVHPSHGERLIKIFGREHHEVCEAEPAPEEDPWARP
jgi:glutathione reductase (NADPH)